MRIGIGYDIHRLCAGRPLIVGGVHIPYQRGLLGVSDADVLLHALIDALLGAAALGDIGAHFPEDAPSSQGADSMVMLRAACRLLAEHGYRPLNIDANIIAEQPRMAPYIQQMRVNIAAACDMEPGGVSVKAKTAEGLDAVGRGEALAAQVIVMIGDIA
ncbi:MAG: 2-C-methyl-D-erythritol 2,4-cyclodiphosphate synthase [Bacillota bacterium]|nr:2-C-methyl-D-erythritol 2,4-cyclodiphosphate synthase [Bacillota bacterium]